MPGDRRVRRGRRRPRRGSARGAPATASDEAMTRVEVVLSAPSQHDVTAGPERPRDRGVPARRDRRWAGSLDGRATPRWRASPAKAKARARPARGPGEPAEGQIPAESHAGDEAERHRGRADRRGHDDPPAGRRQRRERGGLHARDPPRLVVDLPGMKSGREAEHRGRLAAGAARARGRARGQGARGDRRRVRCRSVRRPARGARADRP